MPELTQKNIVILCQQPPYGSATAREGIELCLAASVYLSELKVVFTGDGVWQLVRGQDTTNSGNKQHDKLLAAFPLYDIDLVYADQSALDARELSPGNLIDGVTAISAEELAAILANAEQVLSL